MLKDIHLSEKTCVPCEGGIPPLDRESAGVLLDQLSDGWTLNAAGHLYKKYSFKNFMEPMSFAS